MKRTLVSIFASLGLLAGAVPAGAGGLDLTAGPDEPEVFEPVDDGIVAYLDAGPSTIPVHGEGHAAFEPLVEVITDFVRHRCIGAATFGVSYHGEAVATFGIGRTNGRTTEAIIEPGCGDDGTDPYDPLADDVDEHTPMRLGSDSKPVTAAVTRWSVQQAWEDATGAALGDEDLEDLLLFDGTGPITLFPEELRQLYNGEVPMPDELRLCDDLGGTADTRWQEATLAHILGHAAGLPKSAPSRTGSILPRLPYLRGLDSMQGYVDQHQAARDAAPVDWLTFEQARDELDDAALESAPGDIVFLPDLTLEEILAVVAGRCLDHVSNGVTKSFGQTHYSNTSPAFWATIVEHLHDSGRFAADWGRPETHEGSALDEFLADFVGIETTGSSGIFDNVTPPGGDRHGLIVPRGRSWSDDDQTYMPQKWSDERLHCEITADYGCDFGGWADGPRADWSYDLAEVDFDRSTSGLGGPTGGLVAEPGAYLELMSKVWITGYGLEPRIGQPRNGEIDYQGSHTGSVGGGRAWAAHFAGGTKGYFTPPVDPAGGIVDDYANLTNTGSFAPPAGVDVFFAVNQRSDKKCTDSEMAGQGTDLEALTLGDTTYDCSVYGLMDDVLTYGLSLVDWDAVAASVADPELELDLESRGDGRTRDRRDLQTWPSSGGQLGAAATARHIGVPSTAGLKPHSPTRNSMSSRSARPAAVAAASHSATEVHDVKVG